MQKSNVNFDVQLRGYLWEQSVNSWKPFETNNATQTWIS